MSNAENADNKNNGNQFVSQNFRVENCCIPTINIDKILLYNLDIMQISVLF